MSSTDSTPSEPTHTFFAPLPLYSTPPPKFGHEILKYFSFDPAYINLNHGSYGSLPAPVAEAIKPIADMAEVCPDKFHRFQYIPMLEEVRRKIAKLLSKGEESNKIDIDEVVCVPNASHGISTVLRNFLWEEGDVLIDCNTTYNSVGRTVQYLSDVPPHPKISQFTMLFPTTRAKILEDWRVHVRSLQQTRVQFAQTKPTPENPSSEKLPKIVAIIDSIASMPGVSLPWVEMVQIIREECDGGGNDNNVWCVIDAAHSIGQDVDLSTKIQLASPDFLITNCHKWLFTKRSCAILYVPKKNQHIIKTSFPTSASYIPLAERKTGGEGFVDMFTWNGTIDFIPYLSVAHALHFRAWIGGEEKINEWCRNIGKEGSKKMVEIFGTESLDPQGEFELNLVNIAAPFPSSLSPKFTPEIRTKVDALYRRKMLFERNMFAPVYWHNDKWWIRCSAQVWSEVEDFEKVAHGIVEVCKEIIKELALEK